MVSIISALIILLIIFVLSIFSSWLDKFGQKHKEEILEKIVETASDKLAMAWNKVGPWYLVYIPKKTATRYGSLTTISAAFIPTLKTAD